MGRAAAPADHRSSAYNRCQSKRNYSGGCGQRRTRKRSAMPILQDKKILLTGLLSNRSIAYGIGKAR
jgi:hypothetical protein